MKIRFVMVLRVVGEGRRSGPQSEGRSRSRGEEDEKLVDVVLLYVNGVEKIDSKWM